MPGMAVAYNMAGHLAQKKKMLAKKKRSRRRHISYESSDDDDDAALLKNQDEHVLLNRCAVSNYMIHLNDKEEDLFAMVKSADVNKLHSFLQENPSLNISCQDHYGNTALSIAVVAEDVDMVHYLLQLEGVTVGDTLLLAVKTGNIQITGALLDKENLTEFKHKHMSKPVSIHFMSDITPLILAAHCDNYEMIRLLLNKGHTIYKIHPPTCVCEEECRNKKLGESLRISLNRYNMYRALASPSYICQTSDDPICTAFQLAHELKGCSKVEREFKANYRNLMDQVSKYAVDLIGQCCTTEEVELILTNPNGIATSRRMRFPRLEMAMDYMQKDFISHPNCQQVLLNKWLEGWPNWRSLSSGSKLSQVLIRSMLLPFLAIIYFINPQHRLVQDMKGPLNKFCTYVMSYILFLLLIVCQIGLDGHNHSRGPPSTGLEPLIILFVMGLSWRSIKTLFIFGPKRFFGKIWNVYKIVMIMLFYCAFVCWFLSSLTMTTKDNDIMMPRYQWSEYDPVLIGELFYAFASVMAFGKLMFFFQIGNALGPLQVSMSYMIHDMLKFLVVYIVVIGSFAIGLHLIYFHYREESIEINGSTVYQSQSFTSYASTFKTLFWAIYGYCPPEIAQLVIRDYYETQGNETVLVNNKHRLTERFGMFLYAFYNVAGILVMINMLIAMMSTSFANVQIEKDKEWKVARTSVWLTFFDNGQTLPPPFNLIPRPSSVIVGVKWCLKAIVCDPTAKCSAQSGCYFDVEREPYNIAEYNELMVHVVMRYMNHHLELINKTVAIEKKVKNLHNLVSKMSMNFQGDNKDDSHSTLPDESQSTCSTVTGFQRTSTTGTELYSSSQRLSATVLPEYLVHIPDQVQNNSTCFLPARHGHDNPHSILHRRSTPSEQHGHDNPHSNNPRVIPHNRSTPPEHHGHDNPHSNNPRVILQNRSTPPEHHNPHSNNPQSILHRRSTPSDHGHDNPQSILHSRSTPSEHHDHDSHHSDNPRTILQNRSTHSSGSSHKRAGTQ